jgi:hypothetical protein
VATILVAASPQPAAPHIPAAAVSFGALALWPAFSGLPDRRTGIMATAVMLVLLGWLGAELRDGDQLGLSERLLAGFQALWPLLVALIIDRRALIVASLSYLLAAVGYLVSTASALLGGSTFATLVVIGVIVLIIGMGWQPARRLILAPFRSQPWLAKLPPVRS